MIDVAQKYDDFLMSFLSDARFDKSNLDLSKNRISEDLFFQIFKIKLSGWKYRVKFNRVKKHSIADIFQDLIALYLKACLSGEYSVELEKSINNKKPHVDILILKNGIPDFVIEVKTTIGWSRNDLDESFNARRKEIHDVFNIPLERIVYIFLEHSNVSKSFSAKYWDKKQNKPIDRKNILLDEPYSFIYPFFNDIDPYYSDKKSFPKGFNKDKEVLNFTDEDIRNRAAKSIVTPFEHILEKISS